MMMKTLVCIHISTPTNAFNTHLTVLNWLASMSLLTFLTSVQCSVSVLLSFHGTEIVSFNLSWKEASTVQKFDLFFRGISTSRKANTVKLLNATPEALT